MKIIIILLMLTACSSSPTREYDLILYKNADERAIKHIKIFERYYNKNISNITIKFKDLKGTAGGTCDTKKRTIEIDEPLWEYEKDEYAREEVIFHELGHCVLGLGHDYFIKKRSKCPTSIMYYKGAAINGCYRENRSYYIRELLFRMKNYKKTYNYRLIIDK